MASYFVMFSVVAMSGIGYYIYKNDAWVKSKLFDIGWNLTKFASECSDKIGIDLGEKSHIKKDDSDDESDYESGEEMIPMENDHLLGESKSQERKNKLRNRKLKYYNVETNTSHSLSVNDDLLFEAEKQNMDLVFLKVKVLKAGENGSKKEKYYYRMDANEIKKEVDVNEKKIEKQFLQIELINKENGDVSDIHHNLESFYLIGNKILDKLFLKWYLDYFYSKELPKKYELKIFDKNINMFSIDQKKYVILTEDGYKIESEI